jgi:hypothetical protein
VELAWATVEACVLIRMATKYDAASFPSSSPHRDREVFWYLPVPHSGVRSQDSHVGYLDIVAMQVTAPRVPRGGAGPFAWLVVCPAETVPRGFSKLLDLCALRDSG